MSSLETTINNVLIQQDVELAQAMQQLSNDPSKLSQFVSARKGELYTTVTKEHSDNFQKVYGDLTRSSDVVKNILYYQTRNKDLDGLQRSIFDKAKSEADAATFNSQNAKRQYEVNEWTASNKADTLFFLQLLFITLTLTAPLLYLSRIGWVPSSVFYGLMTLITVALVLTLAVRLIYTQDVRDNRFWNRRRFAQMGGPPTPPTCEAIEEITSRSLGGVKDLTAQAQNVFQEGENRLSGAYASLMGSKTS